MGNQFPRLTANQLRVFRALKGYIFQHQKSPTLKELAGLINVSSIRSVTQYLNSLEKKGLIARSRYKSRSIRLISDNSPLSDLVTIPVVGNAGCDNLSIIAEQRADEFVTVDRRFLKSLNPKKVIAIKAIGKSMVDAGINSGDLVLTEVTSDVREGDKVVAIIDDMAVIKKISFGQNSVILNPMSHDSQYRPIVMKENFIVDGRVIDIIRNSKNENELTYEKID
ncbi:MAG: transcriptional repressor LexA [Patescibacteria group bacterium]|jgi:repressor LexA